MLSSAEAQILYETYLRVTTQKMTYETGFSNAFHTPI